jgi:hypothetical protein
MALSVSQKTRDESPSLSHFLEQAHAMASKPKAPPPRLSEFAKPTIEWFIR